MKFSIKFLLISALAIFLSSCGDINEEMWLNKDGSGKVDYYVDLGEALPMITMMAQGAAEQQLKDAPNGEQAKEKMDEIMEKISGGGIDTSFNIFEIMPDSVRREMDKPEQYKKVNFMVDVDADDNKALLKLSIDFDNFKEIDQLLAGLGKAFGGSRPELENLNMGEMLGGYSFDNNNYLSKKEFKQRSMFQEGGPGLDEMVDEQEAEQMMTMMFGNSNFVKTIHFPYDVKSVSGVDATIDGNTVILKEEMLAKIKESKNTEMKVVFKKKFLGIF